MRKILVSLVFIALFSDQVVAETFYATADINCFLNISERDFDIIVESLVA